MSLRHVIRLLCSVGARHSLACLTAALLVLQTSASAITVFNNAVGGMAFGVAPLGIPANVPAPTYLNNLNNGRNDILTNPGPGLTANPVVANNTLTVGPAAWGPGQFIWGVQNGGGNGFGGFGTGAAVITGPRFAYRLNDGGVAGGFAASYEILSWDANFTQNGNALVGQLGTFITMGGRVPQAQDAVVVSLRTQLTGIPGVPGGIVELPGLIMAVENQGGGNISTFRLRDGLGGAATPMPGGAAIIVDNAALGTFRGLAFNVLPDLGPADLISIPNGTNFTARITATIYSDPASVELFDPIDPLHLDLMTAALADANTQNPGTLFPTEPLTGVTPNVPEPGTLSLLLIAALACWTRRR